MAKSLTLEEIDALPAGREMDGLVALALMGWKGSIYSNAPWQLVPPEGNISLVQQVPGYSTEWKAMRLVIEKMEQLGLYFEMGNAPQNGRWWFNEIGGHDGKGHHISVISFAETLPLAVCRGALKYGLNVRRA